MPRLFGWGSFDVEPLGAYRDRERKRTTELAQQGRRERVNWNPVDRAREALDRPDSKRLLETISRREKEDDGGGGLMGGLRKVGGKALDVGKGALDVLDAGAETSRDLLEAQLQTNPLTGGSLALWDVIRGRNPVESVANRAAGGGTFQNLASSRSPGDFVQQQREDLNQRGTIDRLGTQVFFDPSNAAGIGLGAKATVAGARIAAQGGRGARISGAILRGLGRADTALDAVQARYAREVLGGVGGYTASAMQGGDTQDNLTAAGLGVVAGRASRYLPGRFGTPNAARNFPLGAQITDETPNVERFTEALDRNGIEWAFDEGGVIRVADPERARQIADQEAARYFDDVENTLGQRGDPIATFEGDETYVVKGDPTGTRQDMYYYDSEGRRVSRMPTNSWASTVRNEAADHRGMDDVARIWEVLDEGTPDPRNEVLRQPWPEGAVIQRFKPQSDEWMAYVEEQYRGRTGGAGNSRAIELGRFDGDRWVAERVGPEWSPAATLRAIYTEIEYMETFITRTPKPSEAVRERAFTERLREIAGHLERLGPDAILPPNAAGRTSSGVVPGSAPADAGAPGISQAPRASDEGAAAVPLLEDAGESAAATPTPSVVRRRRASSSASSSSANASSSSANASSPAPSAPRVEDLPNIGEAELRELQRTLPVAHELLRPIADEFERRGLPALPPIATPSIPSARSREMGTPRQPVPSDRPTSDLSIKPTQLPQQEARPNLAPASRGADAEFGVSSGADTPAAIPPEPPSAPPPPREPGPGNPQRGFGQDGPTVDLLEGRARDSVIADAGSALSNSRAQRIREKVGRAKEATIEAITREKQRTDHIVRERTGYQVDQLRARAERSGLNIVADGDRWVLEGTDLPIEDIVEGQTASALAARNSLTPEQRAVLDEVQAINDRWNRTIEAHGGEVARTETGTGEYWTRAVTGREVEGRTIAKNRPGGGGRSLGAARIGRRTQESVEAGVEAGLIYDNPWDALKGGFRNKARIAQDHYLANMVSPLAQPAARGGFGYRSLKGNHPLLEKVRYVGATDSGGTLLGRGRLVFPNEVADALDDLLTPTSIADTKLGRGISAVNSVATPARAMADMSYLLNQGMGFLQSSPRNAIKAMRNGVDVVASALGKPEEYYRALDAEVARGNEVLSQAGITEDAGEWLTARGQHYVDEDAVYEFQFPKWVENAPVVGGVVKWSNETFARYLNLARVTLNVDELERAIASGMRGDELSRHMEDAIKATNRMTGWSGSKVTGLEQIALFAPRFFRSQFEQIAAAVGKQGIERTIARQHLMRLAGFGIAATVAANEARGYPTDFDPRSNNFLRIRNIGGQDISPFGPFATIIRAAAQGVAGEPGDTRIGDPLGGLERFMRAKASPAVGTLWSLMTEQTYDGRPVTKNPREKEFWTNTIPDIGRESIPFSAQALVNEGIEPAIRDRNPKALVSGAIGAGLSALGAQASQVTPAEKRDFRRDKVAAEMFNGAKYDDLTGAQKAQVNEDPEVAEHQAEAERRQLEGTGDDRKRAEAQRAYLDKIEANSTFLETGRDDAGSVFTGNDFRDAYNDAVQQRIGAFATLEDIGGDKALRGYFDLYEKATMANGQLNHEEFDRLESQYILKHPGVLRKVDEVVGTRDNATMREFRKAKVQAAQYYQIPAYKGMTVEDANKATEIITRANALVSYGRAPNRAGALAYLVDSGEITEAERLIAITAAKNGANPERRAFRVDPANKPFAKFYSDLTAKEAALDAGYATPVNSSGGSSKRKPAITSSSSSSRRRSRRR